MSTGYERQSWTRHFGPGDPNDVTPLSEAFGLAPLVPVQLRPDVEVAAGKLSSHPPKRDVSGAFTAKLQVA